MENQRKYALITGATGGLGGAFVWATLKREYALVLTGRSQEKLQALKAEIEKDYPQATVEICAADLTSEQDRAVLKGYMTERGIRLSLLVNAAGADIQKPLLEYTEEKSPFNAAPTSRQRWICAILPLQTPKRDWKLSIYPAFRGYILCRILRYTALQKARSRPFRLPFAKR